MDLRPIGLIVNADDFGYFDQVSGGIVAAMEMRAVTATGVMANGPALERWVDRLRALPGVSVGVHLNASLGAPLTESMRAAVGVKFPSKGAMALALVTGRIPQQLLLSEWRAQILRSLQLGLKPVFINSHEHLHMLPRLLPRVRALAMEFGIRHVREPRAEWRATWNLPAHVRNAALTTARLAASGQAPEPLLIGLAPSGRLDLEYCRWRFARLQRGREYELMCHPGWSDPEALREPTLAAYHDWEGEMRTLTSPEFTRLLAQHGIHVQCYQDLQDSVRRQ